MTRRRDATGAATVLVVACLVLLLWLGLALGTVAALVLDHRRAQAAADLAALAGAGAVRAAGTAADPCAEATRVAAANGAGVRSCRVEGRDVLVETEVDGPRLLGRAVHLRARARAGPSAPAVTQEGGP